MKGAPPVTQMKECPKCGYAFSPGGRQSRPDSECPRCGVIFRKLEESFGGPRREPVTNGLEILHSGSQFGLQVLALYHLSLLQKSLRASFRQGFWAGIQA
jgi:ribosomal protein S27AE